MDRMWDKKKLQRLMAGDLEIVEAWLETFSGVIYTWLYYQVGADAEIAGDLTTKTFKRAMLELDTYNLHSESMLGWLREQARAARDEGLEIRQIKPQRPWAWSQLTDRVLCALSQLRNEPLSEEVTNNTYVREMVQATLTEMEAPNRELMKHRYNRLETPEQIAETMGQSPQDINDRLYRSRHFFRRVLMQLIQSSNPGFAESNAAGTLELLDANLEKLLSATNMTQPLSPKEQAHLREIVLETARETAPRRRPNGDRKLLIIGLAAGVILLGAPLLGLFIWQQLSATPPVASPAPPPTQTPAESPQATAPTEAVTDPALAEAIEREELLRVFELGQQGDVEGLMTILRDGTYASQMAAALFIARLGDESAIGMLDEAQMRWYPDGPADNPFAEALALLEERLLAESGAVIEEPNQPETAAPSEESTTAPQEATADPGIYVTVTGYSGEPIEHAQVILSKNPLYAVPASVTVLRQDRTSQQGHYRFNDPPEGAYYLECRAPREAMAFRQALWCGTQTVCRVNFGGVPMVSGLLVAGPDTAAEQMLFLSDTLNPSNASFRAESVTGPEGQFSFVGVKPGAYYLLQRAPDNRIVRLSTLDAGQADVSDLLVNLQQAQLTVELQAPETAPSVLDAMLTYGPDVSPELVQFILTLQDNGTYISKMIPQGSYTLITTFDNGMRLQQDLELNSDRSLQVTVPEGRSMLSGTFTNPSNFLFFLYNNNEHVRFDLLADANGAYVIDAMPADRYTLATMVNGLRLNFMEIDLVTEPELVLDIDAGELLADYSPVYVAVTDAQGAMLSDAQVWVTGAGEVVTTQSTGRGAFLALMPGEYSLYAALPGYSTAEEVIRVESMPLGAQPNPGNTFHLELKGP